MHRPEAAARLLLLAVPLALAACGSVPLTRSLDLVEVTPVAAPKVVAVDIVPQEILQAEIGNVDVSGRAPVDLWQRMRNGFAIPTLATAAAQDKTTWYAARPDYLRRSFERARPFLFHIVEEIEKRGMPTELALLPLVESAYNPRAVSPAQAAGMWQFIPSTGKRFNLQQDWWRDDRRDVLASTTAALDYLQTLYTMFGDWQLALAAYNWGEGAVSRAIEKARAKGEPTDYASLRMPAETAGYVPKLQAIKNIVMRPELFAMSLPDVPNAPYLGTVVKTRDIDVKMAARLAEMPVEDFIALNPSHNRPVIPGANRPVLVLPADKVETFKSNLQSQQDNPLSTWQTYLLKAGETLDRIAARFGMDVTALKSINGISGRSRVGAGHTLLVQRPDETAQAQLQPSNIDRAAVEAEEKTVRTSHTVARGDTLMAISRKFSLAVADIKRWNKLTGDTLRPGQKLTLETSAAAPKGPNITTAALRAPALNIKAKAAPKGRQITRGPVAKKGKVALRARAPVRLARR